MFSDDQLRKFYKIVEQAVEQTDFDGKTTDQIFGEIYTRVRTEVAFCKNPETAKAFKVFTSSLKDLNRRHGNDYETKTLNNAINHFYERKLEKYLDTSNLEIFQCAMESCLREAEGINRVSDVVVNKLIGIHNQLQGDML